MTGKRFGRIGDSPIIGAGTYADDRSCAVSATGHGEIFIRAAVAHDICARMRFGGRTLEKAVRAKWCWRNSPRCSGEGGVIAIDRERRDRHGIQFRRDVPRQPVRGTRAGR
jgi:beta-aspartyl-peptidase (threonine type)